MSFLTLLTDFGIEDGYVGAMKGVIWQIAPETQIADLTHHVPAQDIFTGSYLLARSSTYFPQGTVHVAVVDPGVGTTRRPLAAKIGAHYFVGPDNGLITFLVQQAAAKGEVCQYVHTNRQEYWLPDVSRVFHGRDIFAPVGAHLCRGVPLEAFGDPINDPILFEIPRVQQTAKEIIGAVLQIDHFGNITTNIGDEILKGKTPIKIRYQNINFGPLAQSFAEKAPGEWVALIDSYHHLSLSMVNGNAAATLSAHIGDRVEVVLQ